MNFFWIAASSVDNPNGIKTILVNGVRKVFINGKPAVINGIRKLRIPPS